MPLPGTYRNPTGKRALLVSINNWLSTNVPPLGSEFVYDFLQELQPAVMPRVEVNEYRYFDQGESAFGGVIFPAATGSQQSEGSLNRTMIEINIYTDQSKTPAAKKFLYFIRDRIVYGLRNAGVARSSDQTVVLPPISVLDPENGNADTGVVARAKCEEDNWMIENYFAPNVEKPGIHQIQLLVKIEWFEMRS